MALIRTAAEAKAAMPRVLSTLSSTALIPDMEAAALKYLVPWIGYDIYASIDGKINNVPPDALTAEETALLARMRPVVAYHAYLDDLGTDNAKITDSGVRTTESANNPRVFGWQYKELKNTLQAKAADSIEVLLKFLHENEADYPLWTGSTEYTQFNSLLIKTGSEFDKLYKLWQPMRSFYAIRHLLAEVQDDFVKNTLGAGLLDYLLTGTFGGTVDDDIADILKQVKRAMVYLTIHKACKHYSVRFDAGGFTITNGDAENPDTAGRGQDHELFEMKVKACENEALRYMSKARNALINLRAASADGDFNTAYDAGPLELAAVVTTRDLGNAGRKIFRM